MSTETTFTYIHNCHFCPVIETGTKSELALWGVLTLQFNATEAPVSYYLCPECSMKQAITISGLAGTDNARSEPITHTSVTTHHCDRCLTKGVPDRWGQTPSGWAEANINLDEHTPLLLCEACSEDLGKWATNERQ